MFYVIIPSIKEHNIIRYLIIFSSIEQFYLSFDHTENKYQNDVYWCGTPYVVCEK